MDRQHAMVPPFVSVIVPVYNNPPGITSCVSAILRQTYPADLYEIIVADNGSTDGTRAAAERFRSERPRVRVVVEDRIRSSYAARNRGLRDARGRILAFTDADCSPAPGWIEGSVRALEERAAMAGAGRIIVTYRSDRPNACEYWDSASHFDQQWYVERRFGATANLFVRAEAFERCGPFRAELVSGGDRELCQRLHAAGEQLTYVADAVVTHPARATLRSAYRKSMRLARAHGPLHRLGAIPSRWECLEKVRSWRCPRPRDWTGPIPWRVLVVATLLHNLNLWLRAGVCLTQGLASCTRRPERRDCAPVAHYAPSSFRDAK
jgi:glycosyltransferase involved in cell wall biosynthesis